MHPPPFPCRKGWEYCNDEPKTPILPLGHRACAPSPQPNRIPFSMTTSSPTRQKRSPKKNTAVDRSRDWVMTTDPEARLRVFIQDGTVCSHRDILMITGSLFSGPLAEDPIEELFGKDETNDQEHSPQGVVLQVFQVIQRCLNQGLVDDWFAEIVDEYELQLMDIAVLCVLMAQSCGMAPGSMRSIGKLQDLLGASPEDRLLVLESLVNSAPLIQHQLVVSDGDARVTNRYMQVSPRILSHLTGDPEELFQDSGTQNKRKGASKQPRFPLRPPSMTMDQLVLPPSVRQQIDLAIGQIHHGHRLFEEWGLAGVMPYGTGTTMLFSGPPGTGKTACAEAIAAALKRPLMEVNLVQVQSRYVGDCEKALSQAFREAQENDAILFWDEADGIVHNRTQVDEGRTWPISQTTTFLKELERFDGVCIVATNFHEHLDPAIDRRLSLKIVFPTPDHSQRESLWQTLLPASLPQAKDIDLARLAQHPLSGGQIKNVVLNAARIAVMRGAAAVVEQADLQQALDWERAGSRHHHAADSQPSPAVQQVALPPPSSHVEDISLPHCRVNTRPLSPDAQVALEMTGVRAPQRVTRYWTGKRFITHNGSLVQLTQIAIPQRRGGSCLVVAVLHGGHGNPRWPGHAVGSTYIVDGDGAMVFADDTPSPPDIVTGMTVTAEVIED
ncbi:MAG: ATP-binding protein [Planctomycetota bacterium]|nr:MAG: ATP-binding protein [Planctomycetota bacterium]